MKAIMYSGGKKVDKLYNSRVGAKTALKGW
jgi:hypothetical protein